MVLTPVAAIDRVFSELAIFFGPFPENTARSKIESVALLCCRLKPSLAFTSYHKQDGCMNQLKKLGLRKAEENMKMT